MALIQVNMMSKSLMRTVTFNVILPVDKFGSVEIPEREEKPYKTLYLLHGIFGNYTDWVTGTCVQRYADEKNLAVVMPSGENMFYVDQPDTHNNYGEFVGKELVEITRKMFPLSRKREDTYIGGLSMGGYGALRNGLKYHDTFGRIVALSAALITDGLADRTDDVSLFIEGRTYAEGVFGDLAQVKGSEKDPKWLAAKIKEEGAAFPDIYMACGTEDGLLGVNRDFKDFLVGLGVGLTYEEGPGVHDWNFWDCYIKKAIDWLPLEEQAAGINSGNVGV